MFEKKWKCVALAYECTQWTLLQLENKEIKENWRRVRLESFLINKKNIIICIKFYILLER